MLGCSENDKINEYKESVVDVANLAGLGAQRLQVEQMKKIEFQKDSAEKVQKAKNEFSPAMFINISDGYPRINSNLVARLRDLGFSETSKKYVQKLICYNCGGEDQGYDPGYEIVYSQQPLGVTVKIAIPEEEDVTKIDEVNGINIWINDKGLEQQFLSKLLKMKFKKGSCGYYYAGSLYVYVQNNNISPAYNITTAGINFSDLSGLIAMSEDDDYDYGDSYMPDTCYGIVVDGGNGHYNIHYIW